MRLYICEKPSQAADIAKHVGARQSGSGCRTGPGVTVTWCIGHLLEQSPPEHYKPELAVWSLDHLPVLPAQWNMDVKASTKSQFSVVAKLLKQATEVVVATDADREGEVIAREVMQLCGYRGPVKRLWLSSLDDASVKKALGKLLPGEKTLPLYHSGLGRARADWLAGMNLTIALTKAFGGGKGGVVHCGRVQTPVLALVVRRERAIRDFKPKPYFVLKTIWEITGQPVPMTWQTPAERLDKDGHCVDEAYITAVANKISGKAGRLTRIERDDKSEQAPLLYSLSSLQKEASAKFGFGAQQVLSIAQSLYEKHKATTYPRTDCEYLPLSMHAEAPEVCAAIKAADPAMAKLVAMADLAEQSRVFNDKKITAHHAIIPTLNSGVRMADMSAQERLLYDLIRWRYLAQFLGVYKFQETRITGHCEGEPFTATGRVPMVPGWKRAYVDVATAVPAKKPTKANPQKEDDVPPKDLALPAVELGQQIINRRAEVAKTQTKPPKRYTEGTLVAAMESIDKEIEDPRLRKVMQNKEKAGIGTDATRGATLEGLAKRGYFDKEGKNIVPTARGEQLIDIVERVVPHMADPVLTALWEDHLAKVEDGSIPLETFEGQLGTWLTGLVEKIRQLAATTPLAARIGTQQSSAPQAPQGASGGARTPSSEKRPQSPAKPAAAASAGQSGEQHSCPACGKPMRQRSSASGAFWGCGSYPACRTTLPDDGGKPGAKSARPAAGAAPAVPPSAAAPRASTPPAPAAVAPSASPPPASTLRIGGAMPATAGPLNTGALQPGLGARKINLSGVSAAAAAPAAPLPVHQQEAAAPAKQPPSEKKPPGVAALTPGQPLADLVAQRAVATAEDAQRQAWATETTERLVAALTSYGCVANVVATRLTPNGAIIRFAGSDKLRVEDIENRRTHLLTTHAIELVTVQPRPGEVAVTVAGIKREPISMWELWKRRKLNRNAAGINTSFLLGVQEISGALLYLNLGSDFEAQSVHEPHTLIAGTTGSGKSVLIQTLMLDIAATNPPELAQITLVDPKMGVDYLPLADLPHMRGEVIIDKSQAAEVLDGLVQEMETRYRMFAGAKARDLAAYNAKAAPCAALPMLFLVHDEFADWMLDKDYADAVGAAVQRLGVKARAAGIHLVFCAQRPDKDVMPMQLRENLGNRLALKVTSAATSRIVLDQGGAEQLLGRGHLAARLAGDGLVIAQCPYIGDADVQQVVDAVRDQII